MDNLCNDLHSFNSKGKMTLSGPLIYCKVSKTNEQNIRVGKKWSGK